MQFEFKLERDKNDAAYAFALRNAMHRLSKPTTGNLGVSGEHIGCVSVGAKGTRPMAVREQLLPHGTRMGRALRGIDLASEARRESYRLLYEDFDAAWGRDDNCGSHLDVARVHGMMLGNGAHRIGEPHLPVNTQPRGYARLNEAFEETFGA